MMEIPYFRILQSWSKQGYIGMKVQIPSGTFTAYIHDGYVNYHFPFSKGHGRDIQQQLAEAHARQIGATMIEYAKENVFVVHDEDGVGRTKTGREVPGKVKATTKKILATV